MITSVSPSLSVITLAVMVEATHVAMPDPPAALPQRKEGRKVPPSSSVSPSCGHLLITLAVMVEATHDAMPNPPAALHLSAEGRKEGSSVILCLSLEGLSVILSVSPSCAHLLFTLAVMVEATG
jgi:hypothetical protein